MILHPLDHCTINLGICLPCGALIEDLVLRALNVLRLQKYPDISVCSIQPPIYFETKTVICALTVELQMQLGGNSCNCLLGRLSLPFKN